MLIKVRDVECVGSKLKYNKMVRKIVLFGYYMNVVLVCMVLEKFMLFFYGYNM